MYTIKKLSQTRHTSLPSVKNKIWNIFVEAPSQKSIFSILIPKYELRANSSV